MTETTIDKWDNFIWQRQLYITETTIYDRDNYITETTIYNSDNYL